MQVRKTGTIGVDGEDRAITQTAARKRRPIEGVARQKQAGIRSGSVTVGKKRTGPGRETMQVRKTRAIGVNGEHRAIARTAAIARRSIQRAAQKSQRSIRSSCIAAGRKRTGHGGAALEECTNPGT